MKRVLLLCVAMAVGLTGCGANRSPTAFEKKAADAASAVVAAARTVMLAAQAADRGGAFTTTTTVTIADAEGDAAGARDAFARAQPPDAAGDQLRVQVLPEIQRAVDVIALVRIAADRGGTPLEPVAAPLRAVAADLDAFAASHG
jgi:hypothetical protein